MRGLIFSIAVLLCAVLQGGAHAQPACALSSPPRVLASEAPRLVQVWDVPDAAVYWSNADPDDAAFAAFKAGVARHVRTTDPVALLRASPGFDNPRLKANNALVADHAAAWIAPAGCLEKLLVTEQHKRVDTFVRATEFAALVLRSPDGARLRIYYLTIDADGIGRMSPLTEPALTDVRAGWRLEIALHNHAFHPDQPSLDGVLAPSEADAQFAVNLAAEAGLQSAWITNGLHTSRIPASAFGLFIAP
jgi:hypothetical protein